MALFACYNEFGSTRFKARAFAPVMAVAATGGLAVALLPGPALAAGHPAVAAPSAIAYAYGNKPASHSYIPESNYSYNSTGNGIRITRSGTGRYKVHFYGLGALANQGTVDVTAEGLMPSECKVTSWGPDSTHTVLQVGVDCFKLSGAPLNTYFMAAFTSGGSTTGTVGYVWANKPSTHSYTPEAAYQFNSSGGTNKITRLGTGQYKVKLPGPVVAGGTVKVTAYGTNADSCQVEEWVDVSPGQDVYVDCFTHAGTAADSKFTMTYAASDDLMGDGGAGGYLWANDPTAASYTPALTYQYDTASTQATVIRLQKGEWENAFPNAGQGNTGDQQATPYGPTPAQCIVDGPAGTVGGTETGDVLCWDVHGHPMDVTYTTQWWVN